MTPYEILGVRENASQQEIKAAYRTLAKIYHPDVNAAPNAAAFFRLVQEAYETLSAPAQARQTANSTASASSTPPPPPANEPTYHFHHCTEEEINEIIKNQHIIKNKVFRFIVKIPVYLISGFLRLAILIVSFFDYFSKIIGGLYFALGCFNLLLTIFQTPRTASDWLSVGFCFVVAGVFVYALQAVALSWYSKVVTPLSKIVY